MPDNFTYRAVDNLSGKQATHLENPSKTYIQTNKNLPWSVHYVRFKQQTI